MRFDCGKGARNPPRGYKVELSADGTNWDEPILLERETGPVVDLAFVARPVKSCRITPTVNARNAGWTMENLIFFRPVPAQAPGE